MPAKIATRQFGQAPNPCFYIGVFVRNAAIFFSGHIGQLDIPCSVFNCCDLLWTKWLLWLPVHMWGRRKVDKCACVKHHYLHCTALHCLSTLRTPWWTDLNSSWTLNYLLDDLLSVNNRAAGKLNRQVFMYLCNYISFIPAMNLLCMWLNDLPIKQYCRIWRSKTECSKRQNTFSAWWTVCNSLEK